MTIFFLLKEGIVNLKRARLAALISILSISLSLTLIGIFALVGDNIRDLFIRFYRQIEIEAFLEPGLSASKIEKLRKEITENQEVDRVVFISEEKALEEFQANFGEDLSGIIDENPLPASLRIVLKPSYSSAEWVEKFAHRIETLPGIQEVIYQKEIIRFLDKYFSLSILIAGILAITLISVITLLVFNTIRLTIHSRQNIIQIMKLVGATNWFIKSPFIIEGIIQGILGGVIAWFVLSLMTRLIRVLIFPQLVEPPHLYPALILMGFLLGWFGSYLSVNRYLKY
ncbi:MAG: permease-like cell division protein FtsX [Calditrichia bacterium]